MAFTLFFAALPALLLSPTAIRPTLLASASIHRPPPSLHRRASAPRAAAVSTSTIPYDGQTYTVKVQSASVMKGSAKCPPIVCIPPVGVGITREFYEPLHREVTTCSDTNGPLQ